MQQPGRKYSAGNKYRYGFNGKENDNEVKVEGGQQDYGMRIYDQRLGKFLSIDPLTKSFPFFSPYHYASSNPILNIDLDGLEGKNKTTYADLNPIERFFFHSVNLQEKLGRLTTETVPTNMVEFQQNVQAGQNSILFWLTFGEFTASTIRIPGTRSSPINSSTVNNEARVTTILKNADAAVPVNVQLIKNETAMGSSAAAETVAKNKVTAATSGQITNRGRGTALEKSNNSAAQIFEDGVEGAASDVASKKRIVPTLKYDNPNPKGRNFIKFDGVFGSFNFIDRKINVTGFEKSIDQIRRAAEALAQNPGSTLRYEVPTDKVNAMITLIKKAGQFLNPNISVVGIPR